MPARSPSRGHDQQSLYGPGIHRHELEDISGQHRRDTSRGLALRMDHGTQYTPDHFLNQIRFWSITIKFAFGAVPETNDAAKRFDCTH